MGLPMWDELTAAIMVDDAIATKSGLNNILGGLFVFLSEAFGGCAERLHVGVDHSWGPSYGSTLVFNTSRSDNGGGFSHPWWADKLQEAWRVITDVDTVRFEELYCRVMKKEMAKE